MNTFVKFKTLNKERKTEHEKERKREIKPKQTKQIDWISKTYFLSSFISTFHISTANDACNL